MPTFPCAVALTSGHARLGLRDALHLPPQGGVEAIPLPYGTGEQSRDAAGLPRQTAAQVGRYPIQSHVRMGITEPARER